MYYGSYAIGETTEFKFDCPECGKSIIVVKLEVASKP